MSMSLRFSPLLFPAAMMMASPAMAEIQLGAQKTFKDWIVACDNTLSCEAIALHKEDGDEEALLLSVSRDAATGSVEVQLSGADSAGNRYRVMIDGRVISSGALRKEGFPSVVISGAEALKLTRAMAKGKLLTLDDGRGDNLGNASLTGSAAALRYIDTTQNRAGTSTALEIAGRKSLRPKYMPMPAITVKRIIPTEKVPDAAALVELVEGSPCATERLNVTEDSAYSLGEVGGKAKTLVLISCGAGAYNISYVAYTGVADANGKWRFTPARFDYESGALTEDKSLQYLTNADWDSATQKLVSFHKGRGLSDCGAGETYVWDGVMFRLVSAEGMSECRGSLEWLTLWTAAVEIVD
jgi:hypothetical protein